MFLEKKRRYLKGTFNMPKKLLIFFVHYSGLEIWLRLKIDNVNFEYNLEKIYQTTGKIQGKLIFAKKLNIYE